nr:MAG TPA: hypothetical protein [Caudoviricetes sp.]
MLDVGGCEMSLQEKKCHITACERVALTVVVGPCWSR